MVLEREAREAKHIERHLYKVQFITCQPEPASPLYTYRYVIVWIKQQLSLRVVLYECPVFHHKRLEVDRFYYDRFGLQMDGKRGWQGKHFSAISRSEGLI